jgi:hypothetical protein
MKIIYVAILMMLAFSLSVAQESLKAVDKPSNESTSRPTSLSSSNTKKATAAQQVDGPIKPTDWLMVGLTAIYVSISGAGLLAISKQTKIAADAANAALLSAQTLINSERPFVMIELRGERADQFWAVNYGKSPAQIIFSNPTPFVTFPKLENLPETLDYGAGYEGGEQFNVQWIPPGGEFSLGAFDENTLTYLGETTLAELNNYTRVFLVYSAFKYRGLDRQTIYVSKYCYRRFGGALRMWGNYGWNEYT